MMCYLMTTLWMNDDKLLYIVYIVIYLYIVQYMQSASSDSYYIYSIHTHWWPRSSFTLSATSFILHGKRPKPHSMLRSD